MKFLYDTSMERFKSYLAGAATAVGVVAGGAGGASAQAPTGNLAEFLGLRVDEEQTFANKGTLTLIHQSCAENSAQYVTCDFDVISLQTLQAARFKAEYRQDEAGGDIHTSFRKVEDLEWSTFEGKQARDEINTANDAAFTWAADHPLSRILQKTPDGKVVQNEVRLIQAATEESLKISSILPVNENFGFVITNTFNDKSSNKTSFAITPLTVHAGMVSSAQASRDMDSEDYDYAYSKIGEAISGGGTVFRP